MSDHRLLNVCFHGIGAPRRILEPGEHKYWIGGDTFQQILDELVSWPDVRISFDDGNASDIEIGLPALVDRGLSATFFVLAGRFDTAGSLSESDVIELRRNDMTIGTHGMDHIPWRKLTGSVRERELIEARDRIAEVAGAGVDEAALPLGQYDRKLLADLRALGYRTVHTSDRRTARQGHWLQPRFSVTKDDTVQSLRSTVLQSPSVVRRLELSAKGILKRLR